MRKWRFRSSLKMGSWGCGIFGNEKSWWNGCSCIAIWHSEENSILGLAKKLWLSSATDCQEVLCLRIVVGRGNWFYLLMTSLGYP